MIETEQLIRGGPNFPTIGLPILSSEGMVKHELISTIERVSQWSGGSVRIFGPHMLMRLFRVSGENPYGKVYDSRMGISGLFEKERLQELGLEIMTDMYGADLRPGKQIHKGWNMMLNEFWGKQELVFGSYLPGLSFVGSRIYSLDSGKTLQSTWLVLDTAPSFRLGTFSFGSHIIDISRMIIDFEPTDPYLGPDALP